MTRDSAIADKMRAVREFSGATKSYSRLQISAIHKLCIRKGHCAHGSIWFVKSAIFLHCAMQLLAYRENG